MTNQELQAFWAQRLTEIDDSIERTAPGQKIKRLALLRERDAVTATWRALRAADLTERKAAHGCTDATCPECDR